MNILNIPTEFHIVHLSAQCASFVLIKKNTSYNRWLGYLHSTASNRVLRNYSHVSHRRVVKVLLTAIEKRISATTEPQAAS